MASVEVIVPAYNEAGRIGPVLSEFTDEYPVTVIDDGSTDKTAAEARSAGATVIEQPINKGYTEALKRGFHEATADIIVTFDADGEHHPKDIPRIVTPVRNNEYDLVLGARKQIPRPSERLLSMLARLRVNVHDSGTGFRALWRSLAEQMVLDTACTCGTFVLEAAHHGARIGEVQIEPRSVEKPRRVAWRHGRQFLHVLRYLL